MFYSKSTGGFYDHESILPADAVEIARETHALLLQAQSASKMIAADAEGYPVIVDRPLPSSAEMKVRALNRINAAYQAAVDALTAGYPEDEIRSWPKQEIEARAWLLNSTAATPWIDAAAADRGITKAGLVGKIIAKADLFAPAHGQLTGKLQALRDQMDALGDAPTQEQLDAVQW